MGKNQHHCMEIKGSYVKLFWKQLQRLILFRWADKNILVRRMSTCLVRLVGGDGMNPLFNTKVSKSFLLNATQDYSMLYLTKNKRLTAFTCYYEVEIELMKDFASQRKVFTGRRRMDLDTYEHIVVITYSYDICMMH